MSDFSQDIQNFERFGAYNYNFDSVGNLTFNTGSAVFNQVYLAFPLSNISYNNSKIQAFYDVNFDEFIPQSAAATSSLSASADVLQTQLEVVQQQNVDLQSQLNDFIAQSEVSSSAASDMAIQQVILELRIALGQGRVDSDFTDTFPYTPLNIN
jgi:hypothetical protein